MMQQKRPFCSDIQAEGHDLAYTRIGDFDDSIEDLMMQNRTWESPYYQIAKNTRAISSMTAGALTMNNIGNLTPWYNAKNGRLSKASGWYRKTSNGKFAKLSAQRGVGAGGHQNGAKGAASKVKLFKNTGKILAVASVGFSAYEIWDAENKDYSNKNEVIGKATVDIAITAIGLWGGPVGWVIAGTYFILNVSGAFGDWGVPSGISQSDYEGFISRKARYEYGSQFRELLIETDYSPSDIVPDDDYYFKEETMYNESMDGNMPKIVFERYGI